MVIATENDSKVKYGKTDAWVETHKLLANDISDTAWFGYAIDIDGGYAVISACWSDEHGKKSGSAYIRRDYVVTGSLFGDDYGKRSVSAYVFKKKGSSWTEQAKLTPDDGAQSDWFGVNVSIEGEYIAIGSRFDNNEKGIDAGSVYIYKRSFLKECGNKRRSYRYGFLSGR